MPNLEERLETLVRGIAELKADLAELKAQMSGKANTGPMTARELAQALNVKGEDKASWRRLKRKCDFLNLRPLTPSRGWSASFDRAKVLRAIANA